MNIYDLLSKALRNLTQAKARTLLTSLAIAVGSFALSLTLAASNGAERYADQLIAANFDPAELIVTADQTLFESLNSDKPKLYNPNSRSVSFASGDTAQIETLGPKDVAAIAETEGIERVRTVTTVNLAYITRDGYKKYTTTAQPYTNDSATNLLTGNGPSSGDEQSIIIPESFVAALGFIDAQDAIGKQIRIGLRITPEQDARSLISQLSSGTLPNTITEKTLRVTGVAKKPSSLAPPGSSLYVTIPLQTLESLQETTTKGTDLYQNYVSVYARIKDGENASKLSAAQKQLSDKGYGTQSVIDTQESIAQIIQVLQGIVMVFGLIAVIASLFGVVNTMYISVLQRTREIGLMKALGMRKQTITLLFLVEASLLGLLGGLLGTLAAVAVGTLANPAISNLLGIGEEKMLLFHASQLILLVTGLMLVAMTAGILPARKAAKLDPIIALRTE